MTTMDNRRARRFPLTMPATVKVEESAHESASVRTRDVSSSGVYFHFASPLDVGTALEFVLTLPEEMTKSAPVRIKCMGKVVRVDQGQETSDIGVAATIERYEFLRENPDAA